MSKVRIALRRLWRWNMAFCTIFITFAVLYIIYCLAEERYRYVQLPNGARLAVTEWFTLDGGVVLKNSSGQIVTPPDIGGVVWNDKYVKGWRWDAGKGGDIVFIYKIGCPMAIDSAKATAEEFRALSKQSGLADEHDYLNFPSFLTLIQNQDYHRSWYE
jgi:hypothetical protein